MPTRHQCRIDNSLENGTTLRAGTFSAIIVLSLPLALFLPPRFARCSTPHRHGLKSASVHRFLKAVKSMMPSPRVNLVKC
ncbi:hypothetical protein FOU61_23505 [Salmonella enterica]|nr:hypothetical protein [Salmonella enterica]EBL7607978.1 hypothetical protein [Salmonella enterica]EBM7197101.1 hypothetical protein [Salmonella enterica]ECF6604346.1 hypothetical protein [Salmonella enterica]